MAKMLDILHVTDKEFLEHFRSDLISAVGSLVILSPFVSKNRAINYYPVLKTLTHRNVSINIYIRPRGEQPASLRLHFDSVSQKLVSIGSQVHLRAGMHEKVGIVDDRVLWHGSLNILSHNDTKESMLRLESPALVQELKSELLGETMAAKIDFDETASKKSETVLCPDCNGPMLRFESAGRWLCRRSPECSGMRPLIDFDHGAEGRDRKLQFTGLRCPICHSEMVVHPGLCPKIGCTKSCCGFMMDARLSTGLIRLLKRREQV